MEFAKHTDGAPKNGDLLGRRAQEANGSVQPDWTRLSDNVDGWTDRLRLLFLDAPLPDDETKQTQKRSLTRLILALVTAIVCIGVFVFWIGSDPSSDNSAAKASVAIGGLTAARQRENVALIEALESKRIANSKQMELKRALDESEKRALALERELTSARETIASAEKPSNAEVTARDSPTGSLNRSMKGSNAASEITGSMPTPQSRGNVTAGVQTSSDAMPDDATAGASRRLTRSNGSQPSRPQPPGAMSSPEEAKLVARAESLIKQFDFASARLLLAYALEKGSARAAFMMAETYDWQILRSLQAYAVRGDDQRAREFYQLAAAAGIEKARERVEAWQSDANFDTRVGGEDRSR
jgi:hypothetical protein